MASCKDCRDYDECKKIPYPDGIYPEGVNDVETKCDFYYKLSESRMIVYSRLNNVILILIIKYFI